MSTIIDDLRFSLRLFLRNPGFALIAVVALAIGIGDKQIIRDTWHAFRHRFVAELGPMNIATQIALRAAWKVRRAEARARLQG